MGEATLNDAKLAPIATHPRVILTEADVAALRDDASLPTLTRQLLAKLRAAADRLLDEPPCKREKIGRRMLGVSRQVLDRVTNLALAYRVSDDRRYLQRAEAEMLAAAGFTDWNPSHFLDTAEMTTALALGLDWLHADLHDDSRATIIQALLDKGLRVGQRTIETRDAGWPWATNNWGQVCLGGLAIGSLAAWEHDPPLAEQLVRFAIQGAPARSMKAYAPDGAYVEGPMYWSYGTTYNLLLIEALESALGSDFALRDQPGFMQSAQYINAVTGPSLRTHNYADARHGAPVEPMLWFAGRGGRDEALLLTRRWLPQFLDRRAGASRVLTMTALWSRALPADVLDEAFAPPPPTLSWMGRGITPVASHRSGWDDPRATWLSIKAGQASGPHGHMDVGSFVFEADGVRWAIDLGSQGYHGLESRGLGLWNMQQDSQRWQVFRLGPWSHNILTLGNVPPRVDGRGEIVEHVGEGDQPYTTFDLTGVYEGQAQRVTRTAGLTDDRRRAVVRDVVQGAASDMAVRWAMTTHADIATNGRSAALTQDGQRLRVDVHCECDLTLQAEDVSEPRAAWDEPNPNTRQLIVTAHVPAGADLDLTVQLTPGN